MLKNLKNVIIILAPSVLLLFYFQQIIVYKLFGLANDPGLGWHLKTGQFILENLVVPFSDPFLVNGEFYNWVSNQWLADVIFYALYRVGNWQLLYSFVIAGITYALWQLLFVNGITRLRSILFSVLIFIFVITLHYIHFFIRPVFFQLILFIYLVKVLYDLYENTSQATFASALEKESPKLVLLFLLWANLHPSFAIGLGLIALLILSLFLDRALSRNNFSHLQFFKLIVTGLACFIITLLNPYFFKLHLSIFSYMTAEQVRIQEEWSGLDLSSEYLPIFLILVLTFLVGLYLARKNLRNVGIFPIFSVCFFLILSISAVRYLPFFGVTTFLALSCLVREFPVKLRHILENDSNDLKSCKKVTTFSVYVLLIVLLSSLFLNKHIYTDLKFGPSCDSYPCQSMKILNTASAKGDQKIVVLNDPNWGGYITFEGNGVKATIDDRLFFFSAEYVKDYLALMRTPSEQLLKKILSTQHDYILINSKRAFAQWLKKHRVGEVVVATEHELLIKVS